MAFRKKAQFILTYSPDILVIPECECPENLKFEHEHLQPKDILWFGANKHKGLGVFSYSNYKFKLLECHNTIFKNILPISVSNEKDSFILFAIWANNPEDKEGQYITQVWKAINYYEKLLIGNRIILTGDFNSNTIWDKPKRKGNHSHVVEMLETNKIFSAYHKFYNKEQGKEEHPTLYMYRHKDKPYHIDYCFASIDFINVLKNVEVGIYETWSQYSDHKPLIVDFDF